MPRCLPLFFAALVACGSKPPPSTKAPEPEPPQVAARPKMQAASELGEIDQRETEKTFGLLQDRFLQCHKQGLVRIEYLQGDLKFFLRVGQDGIVRWLYLEDSSLGDHETEKCILDVIKGAQFPKPEGGEAEVRSGTILEAPKVRLPIEWPVDKVAPAMAKDALVIGKCKKDMKMARFHVTIYVKRGKRKRGRVQAVGVATPTRDAEEAVECIVRAVQGWDVPSPGSGAAKVSFDL